MTISQTSRGRMDVEQWAANARGGSPDNPSEGSRAASGPGGNYLSNESMYRSNRLRIGMQAEDVPGGHLHISALVYPEDPAVLTGPEFEADRRAVVDQTIALVAAAGAAAP